MLGDAYCSFHEVVVQCLVKIISDSIRGVVVEDNQVDELGRARSQCVSR